MATPEPVSRSAPRSAARSDSRSGSEEARDLFAIPVAGALAAGLLLLLFQGKATRFEELALGNETAAVFAHFDGDPIHCQDLRDLEQCLAGFERRGHREAALWLGNSQLHGVNQWREGEDTAPALLFGSLRERGVGLITLSQANANLQEHFVLYAYLRQRLPLRAVLLPAVFDDTRETGIRASIATALDDRGTREALEQSEVGRALLAANQSTADPDLAALDETLQESSEARLTAWLERHSTLWRLRPEARGTLGNWLYQARNTAFGITPSSKRRLIEGRYRQSLAAARALLADAEQHGIRVLLYVVPLRDDVEVPYVASEYERFKHDVEALAARHHASFLNVEGVVPASLWGVTDAKTLAEGAAVDFMHFQAGGHAILADRLSAALDAAGIVAGAR